MPETMKSFFLYPFLSCVLLFGSCNKDFGTSSFEGPAAHGELRTLSFNVSAPAATKVTGSVDAAEAAVNTTQILLFKTGGRLEAYGSSANGGDIEIKCPYGSYTAKAVVNGPDCSMVASLSEFNALQSNYTLNSPGNLVMTGSRSINTNTDSSVVIDVSRMVSRVVVRNITRDFESTALAAKTFKILALYVDNVLPSASFGGTACTAERIDHGACKALLYDEVGSTLANEASYGEDHFFYVTPFFGTAGSMRLILEADLNGEVMYYPIAVPDLAPNTSYEISGITLKRPGSGLSDSPIEVGSVSLNVNVVPWTVVETSSELEI